MSSRVFVPFDNNPTSVSIKTSSYTIPAGKYAKVKNLCGNFSINGNIMGRSLYSYSSQTVNNDTISRNNSGDCLKYVYFRTISTGTSSTGSASYTLTVGGDTIISGSINRNSFNFEENRTASNLVFSRSSTWSESGSASFTITTDYAITCDEFELWLPSGTVIDGSKFIVTEYNAIS